MPPHLYLVRHGETTHNVKHDPTIRDPLLTSTGQDQARALQNIFPFHNTIDLIVTSPLRRTIQTAVLAFGPELHNGSAKMILLPDAQMASNEPCNVNFPRDMLEDAVREVFADDPDVKVGNIDIDYSHVLDERDVPPTTQSPDHTTILKQQTARLRNWLFAREEKNIVVVTHGAILHYITEDWSDPMTFMGKPSTEADAKPKKGKGPPRGTGYSHCQVRQFDFTAESKEGDAHLMRVWR